MSFTSPAAEQRYAAVVRSAEDLVVGLDFDGTLAPIVEDPRQAHILPAAPAVLRSLGERCRALAVITGRPADQVLALGGLETVGAALDAAGRELVVLGQYGNEHWSSRTRSIDRPEPPTGLTEFTADLPDLLAAHDLDPWVEDKGLAVGVHTRRLPDPQGAFDTLLPVLTTAAERHGLHVEPGRLVIEVRAGGMDKGTAVRRLVRECDARAILFAGDDLGDIDAFDAVAQLRDAGLAALLVCSDSQEESALLDRADVVVPGPEGVIDLLRTLTADIAARRA